MDNFPDCTCHLPSGGKKRLCESQAGTVVWSACGRKPRAIFCGVQGVKEEQSLPTQRPEMGPDEQVWALGAAVRMHGFPSGCSNILLELLHQVLATDFQFAKQNKFALIRKIRRKDCLDCNAAARAIWIPGLQEVLLTLMPLQACYHSLQTGTSEGHRCPSWFQSVWPFPPEYWRTGVGAIGDDFVTL